MSARISKMYKESGGCSPHQCEECKFLTVLEKRKTHDVFKCNRHQELCNEEAIWKPTYTACKYFKERK